MPSCVVHTIPSDYTLHRVQTNYLQFQILSNNYCFVVDTLEDATITFFIASKAASHVVIYCTTPVKVCVRLFCLFSDDVTIKITLFLCTSLSKISLLGLCSMTDQSHVRIKTEQIHCAAQTESSLLMHGLVSGHAKFDYEGTIRIEKNAARSYALQNNKNILLSSTASAISVPNIEVLHHEVQCYHGAAIGKFDKNHEQYMQARGLDSAVVKKLLLQAFCEQVLVDYEKRELILQTIYEKL